MFDSFILFIYEKEKIVLFLIRILFFNELISILFYLFYKKNRNYYKFIFIN
jgi:hypothetical protein